MKTVFVLFLPLFVTLYSMDVAPYKYPPSFAIESQRTVKVPLYSLGFAESKEEAINLNTSLEFVSKVSLKQRAYEEWLKGNFLLLARIVSMSPEQKPVISWCDMRRLVKGMPQSPRNHYVDRANHSYDISNQMGEIFYYFVPHDKYTHMLGYLCSEKDLQAFTSKNYDSASAELTQCLALYHTEEHNNHYKLQLLTSIITLIRDINQIPAQHIPYIEKQYQALLPTLELLSKKKRSRNDHKMIATQELNKQAQIDSQLQLAYRYLRRDNKDEAVRWLLKVAEQDYFTEQKKDAGELLRCLVKGVPLKFAKKAQVVHRASSSIIKPPRLLGGKDEAEEYS